MEEIKSGKYIDLSISNKFGILGIKIVVKAIGTDKIAQFRVHKP